MKKTSSSGMTCILLSLAAGKSVPPSFCQEICGGGWPSAAHSSRAMAPVRMVRSMGVFRKEGNSGSKEMQFQYFQYQGEKSNKSSTAQRMSENKQIRKTPVALPKREGPILKNCTSFQQSFLINLSSKFKHAIYNVHIRWSEGHFSWRKGRKEGLAFFVNPSSDFFFPGYSEFPSHQSKSALPVPDKQSNTGTSALGHNGDQCSTDWCEHRLLTSLFSSQNKENHYS